jgi:lipopolysaccharide transport system permease protein
LVEDKFQNSSSYCRFNGLLKILSNTLPLLSQEIFIKEVIEIKSSEKTIIIEPGGNFNRYWQDLWDYRELFFFLSWRDILVRYKQTLIGILWSILRPLLTMLVFTIVFGRLANLPSNGIPYPILVFSAMLPWQFFANSISESSNALIRNNTLVSKIFFPRVIIPTTSIAVSFVDFFISFVLLGIFMIYYKFIPGITMLTLPFFLGIAVLAAMGAGLWFSALNVKYRDIMFVVPFVVQFGLYISPVGFSSTIIPEKWKLLYSVNPMVGVIDGFRWAVTGGESALYMPGFILSIIISLVLFCSGLWYFRMTERFFADLI